MGCSSKQWYRGIFYAVDVGLDAPTQSIESASCSIKSERHYKFVFYDLVYHHNKKLCDGLDITLGDFFSCEIFDELEHEIQ